MLRFAVVVGILSLASANTDTDKAKILRLYGVLKDVAMPGSDPDELTSQRFVLQMPGKVLSYKDYFPGPEYVANKNNIHADANSVEILPSVMEKMFQLTDAVPGLSVFKGGDTGESFADLYAEMLGRLDVLEFGKKIEKDLRKYNETVQYLSESIMDPDNLEASVSRLELYYRLEKEYHDKRLQMEDAIHKNRENLKAAEYQQWFKRNFPTLNAAVEAAYTKWIVYGQKDIVERCKAYMDAESQGVDIEDARATLRSSGTISLDRTQMIYPVSFEPSNWYEALVPKSKGPSRDELQLELGSLKARKIMLESIDDGDNDDAVKMIDEMMERKNDKEDNAKTKMSEMRELTLKCMEQQQNPNEETGEDYCADLKNKRTEADKATTELGWATSEYDSAQFLLATSDSAKKNIKSVIQQLDVRIKDVENRLSTTAGVNIAEFAEDTKTTDTDMDASWMDFSFDSSVSETNSKVEKSSSQVSSQLKVGFGWFSVSAGGSASQSSASMSDDMSKSDVTVRAKLLKVTVKRPWFKTSLFKSESLFSKDGTKISPGPMLEKEFVEEAQKNRYLIPQYMSAFLLAKDIEMEFRGIKASTRGEMLSRSGSGNLGFSYGPFVSASGAVGHTSSSESTSTQVTADGIRIKVPGAQVIGYYTTVVPKFPPIMEDQGPE